MNDHQPKTFLSIDLAAPGANETGLVVTQNAARSYTDREWLRQRSYELPQVGNGHLHHNTAEVIERPRRPKH